MSFAGPVVRRLPKTRIAGLFYRAVPETAAPFALEDGPSYRFVNRYNVASAFGALYFADREEVCQALLEKRGHLAGRAVPHVLLSFEVKLDGIIDLTTDRPYIALGISRDDLLKSAEIPDAYRVPQELSRAIYDQPGFSGLLTPDATRVGNTLVVFPAKILAGEAIHLKNRRIL